MINDNLKEIKSKAEWLLFLRKYEIDSVLSGYGENYFNKALELGAGSGNYSQYLAFYCKKLIATEYDKNKLEAKDEGKVAFSTLDAQDLSRFAEEEMDLIFSSNLIEHLPNVDSCLSECRRVIKQEGTIIHLVPNWTWKIFYLLLYYPSILERLFRRIGVNRKSQTSASKCRLDDNLRPVEGKWLKKLSLPIHGISDSHIKEFVEWREKSWVNKFKKNGLEIVKIVRLPFYFGHGNSFKMALKLGNKLGMSSSTGYILKKEMQSCVDSEQLLIAK